MAEHEGAGEEVEVWEDHVEEVNLLNSLFNWRIAEIVLRNTQLREMHIFQWWAKLRFYPPEVIGCRWKVKIRPRAQRLWLD